MKKLKQTGLGLIAIATLAFVPGCGQKEETAVTPPAAAQKAAAEMNATKPAAPAAEPVVAQAKTALANAGAKAEGMITEAKKLVGDKKWSDASKILNDLATQNLTPDQQKLVDGLKQQVQKAIEAAAVKKAGDEATKAVGGLLK